MRRHSHIKKAPRPFFDTLDYMKNPVKTPVTPEDIHRTLEVDEPEAVMDYQVASEFIFTYRGSVETFRQYRKTLEQLLAWCWLVNEKPIRKMHRQDVERFMEFCVDPPKSWIGSSRQHRFQTQKGIRVPNPKWRPFCKTGNQYIIVNGTLKTCFNVLGSFFSYLVEEEYILQSPVVRIRQKSKFIKTQQQATPPRTLSVEQWNHVLDAAEELAEFDPYNHERTLFMLSAMFCMYLRISEFAESKRWRPIMGHFFRDTGGRWWFRTVGKGNKERTVTVCDAMLQALRRYRRSRGLTALPLPDENTVLVYGKSRTGAITTTRIRQLCKEVFTRAAFNMRLCGKNEDAEVLDRITPHWLRHTVISFDVPLRPLHHIRDDAGHASIRTTNRYIDSVQAERHHSAQGKTVRVEEKEQEQ